VLTAVAFLAAFLSWRYVERPFRNPAKVSRAFLFKAAAASSCVLVGIAAVGYFSNGLPQRFSPAVDRMASYSEATEMVPWYAQRKLESCIGYTNAKTIRACMHPPTSRTVLVLGDSFAQHSFPGVKAMVEKMDLDARVVAMPGCSPAPTGRSSRDCIDFDRLVHDGLFSERYAAVIVIAHWYYSGSRTRLVDFARQTTSKLSAFLAGLSSQEKVIVVGPLPEYDEPLPNILAREIADNARPLDVSGHLVPDVIRLDRMMAQSFAGSPGITYISAFQRLCERGHCPAMVGQVPVYYDTAHWTLRGSLVEMPVILHGAGLTGLTNLAHGAPPNSP
jgi:SGNH domain (fused to AT3 domains)